MALETFEAGYAGARPTRGGANWSGMWKLAQMTDRMIDGKWPSPWSVSGGNQQKSFAIVSGDSTANDVQFNDDGTKFYILGATKNAIYQYTCATAWDVNTAVYAGKSFSVVAQETSCKGLFFKSDGTAFYVTGSTNKIIYQYTCSTPWDVSTASYSNKTYNLNLQGLSSPTGLFFKPDGTKFYVTEDATGSNNSVFQYTCSTPWDVSTASYDTKFFVVSTQDSIPTGIFFKSDGTKFYILGDNTNAIYQYSCSTAWEINTASYDSVSFSVATQETIPFGLFFKSDGTQLYVVGSTKGTVFQYSLSTAWNLSVVSYSEKAFYVAVGQEGSSSDVQFNDDGTKLYIIGSGNKTVYQYTCSTAWDVSTASYANKAFHVSLQEGSPSALFFKSDGTAFYVAGTTNKTVYQYTCSTAWDVSTASYSSKSFSVNAQETAPQGLFFKPDGTTFYIIGSANNTVYQYSCSTAWDVSTASYASKSFSVTTQETSSRALFFKSDGAKFYVLGSTNRTVYQYSCGTAWDISTASYDSKSFSASTQDTATTGLFFKSDGTTFYIVGTINDTVYQYTCSTAWDVNTTSAYDSKSFSVTAQDTFPADVQFKNDGTKFYILGDTNNTIYQYSCSTAWDVSTASYDSKSFSVATQETSPAGLFFKADGTKFYVVGTVNFTVYQYSCSTAWDVSTASYDSKLFSVGSQEATPNGLFFKSDGAKFYIVGSTNDTVYQYSCSTAWDVSTASYDSKSFSVSAQDGGPSGLFFKSDGTKFYISGTNNLSIYQYSCNTAWDLSTASYDNRSVSVSAQETLIRGLFFKSDGAKFYIVGTTNDTVYQYSTPVAWEIQSPFYGNKFFRVNTQEGAPYGIAFKTDGTKFYIVGNDYKTIFQYSCSTAWDISSGSYDSKTFSVNAQDINPNSLSFKTDGTKFYILGGSNKTVYQYSCATAWDVSTASYDGRSFSVTTQEGNPQALFFKSDGTKFYIVGATNKTVYQYSCGTAWDISTAYYESKLFYIGAQEGNPHGVFFKDDGTKFYITGQNNDAVIQYSCATAWDIGTASYDGVVFGIVTQDTSSTDIQFKSDGTTFYVLGDTTNAIYQYSGLLQ